MSPDMHRELDNEVGGLRCLDVLERLPDYIAGELTDLEVGKVETHLAGCSNCARFGSLYGRTVAAMRGLAPTKG